MERGGVLITSACPVRAHIMCIAEKHSDTVNFLNNCARERRRGLARGKPIITPLFKLDAGARPPTKSERRT